MDIHFKIAVILLVALASGELCIKIGIPSVVGQLIVGVIIGPAMLAIVDIDENISFFSEIGVIALMFMAGLESDLSKVKKYFLPASSVALLGAIVPFVSFFLFSTLVLKENLEISILLGILFSAMSTSITVDTLKEFNSLNNKNGVTIMTSAIFDDIIAVCGLSVFLTIFHISTTGKADSLVILILKQLVFFILIFVVSKYLVPYGALLLKKLKLPFAKLMGSWIVVWLAVGVSGLFNVSDIIAAFICGVAISETNLKEEVLELTAVPAYSLFVPIFLVSVGLDLHRLYVPSVLILVVSTLLAVGTKLFGSGIGAHLTKNYTILDSAIIGAGSIPRGEFSVVIAQIGVGAGIIDENMHAFLLIVIILATVIGPILLKCFLQKNEMSNRNL